MTEDNNQYLNKKKILSLKPTSTAHPTPFWLGDLSGVQMNRITRLHLMFNRS